MRIAVINTQAPFITGGAERHAANLCKAFRDRGFDATEVSLPFKWYPARTLVDHILSAKLVDLGEVEGTAVDLAIGLKFPAYLAKHPNKVFWVLHQHRQAYDLWQSELADLHHDPDGMAVRALIHEEDRRALGAPGATVYSNSHNVSERLTRHLGLPSTPLYHPPPQAAMMRQGPYGDYLFAPSRMNGAKRQTLMLEALVHCRPDTRIVFAGPADNAEFMDAFRNRARALGVADRITCLGPVDDETILRCYAECRGVVFVPVDEDYGYITLEAMLSGKPVVTATDSGGALEFVDDGVEGYVVAPRAQALGEAFDRLMSDADLAERMGTAGLTRYRTMDIGWDNVVATLTDGAASGADPLGADPSALLRHAHRGLGGKADAPDETGPKRAETPAPTAGPAPVPEVVEEASEPDAEAPARLKAEVAPLAPPRDLPFESVEDLRAAHDFGVFGENPFAHPEPGARWRHDGAALALALADRTDRVLEVGAAPPFAFRAMLAAARPDARIEGVWADPRPLACTVPSLRDGLADLALSVSPARIERDPLPAGNAGFDLVTGLSVLDRLAVDPLFFVAEAARVLRPGGRLLLTVPNAADHRALRAALDGDAPRPAEGFDPARGARAGRSYTPQEVAALCEAAGFVTETLSTADLHDDPVDPEVAALLAPRGSFAMRGEVVFYVGRLEAHRPPDRPEGLYRSDPRPLTGRLRRAGHDPSTGSARIGVRNLSSVLWFAEGEGRIALSLDWADARGTLRYMGARRALPAALDEGQEVVLTLPLDPGPPDASKGTVTVALVREGAGPLDGAGRTDTLTLPCSEAAFLRLTRGPA